LSSLLRVAMSLRPTVIVNCGEWSSSSFRNAACAAASSWRVPIE
jgi:hypothetical protein